MTRPTLVRHADNIYRPLDAQIAERMRPVEVKRDGWFWLRVAGYGAIPVLAKAGAIAAFVLLSPVIIGIWVWKMRRAWQ